ncbi:GTPase-activating protein gyp3 [Penicillium diatomitis]|uniref:GTPase-activating protein gyp3 n=1 Tax=Penicillium diatomitis TaxID=2819901 RepID=A0A9W9XH81_9EURO|nr:GTPase-activating protein gyp3 [Penicillium diatomitis]KAJ5492931.1 GTPase-activating protein gyp3 [Penicillium diatomitis]
MATENGNHQHPPFLGDLDRQGRRKAYPPRPDPLLIDPHGMHNAHPTRIMSPRSPRFLPPRSHSPLPPPAGFPTQHRANAPPGISQARGMSHAPHFSTTADRGPPGRYYHEGHDMDMDRPNHRNAPPQRGGLRISMSTSRLPNRRPRRRMSPERAQDASAHGLPLPRFPSKGSAESDELRTSFNSTVTSRSSIEQQSGTERSSVITKGSSITDLSPDTPDAPCELDQGMSVEDAISMYLDGFSDVAEEPTSPTLAAADEEEVATSHHPTHDTGLEECVPPPPTSNDHESINSHPTPPLVQQLDEVSANKGPPSIIEHSPELIASPDVVPSPHTPSFPSAADDSLEPGLKPPLKTSTPSLKDHQRKPSKIIIPGKVPPPLAAANTTRDEYGFRKATQYVTLDQYEAWKSVYSQYASHRRTKWHDMMKEHGLQTTNPTSFPVQSSKVKRFVRKGIPSEYRGAAWFWYAGGHELLNRHPGRYDQLVDEVMSSPTNDDKEHIERDLHRTFPDNLHFKPEQQSDTSGSSNPNTTTETQMIQSLRRVLYAFALHNPKVGYTQSLNFITGMLLLFLPEEKAFWMLHIITTGYLPGTHEVSLEGANIDLWILMVLLRDSMPSIYGKISSMDGSTTSRGKAPALNVNSRLPDITLGLTNWLMSIFIGTLPLETTLRVWDIFFYEGSKTFFRVSLAIFKACEKDIIAVSDPMEVFQVIQTVPKRLLDANSLLEDCFVRRHRVGQGRIEELRASRRVAVRQEKLRRSVAFSKGQIQSATDNFPNESRNRSPDLENRVATSWRNLRQHAFHREPTQ